MYQSKVYLNVKILFGKIIYNLDPEATIMLVRVFIGTRIPHLILVHDLFARHQNPILETDNGTEFRPPPHLSRSFDNASFVIRMRMLLVST